MSMKRKNQPKWDSEHVRALRQHLGFTQQQMARELGTRQQTISEWETGMYKPRGTSSTLLTIVAEKASFKYTTTPAARTKPLEA
jgi:DNA-binding transcriptional regulator YiaG